MRRLGFLVGVLAIALLAGPAQAVTFDGVDYTLSYTTFDAANAIYDVTLTIDTSGATFDQTLLKAAGFKIAAPSAIDDGSSLTAAPGSWTFYFNGQFDSGGCADSPDAGFTCWQNDGAGDTIGGTFTFTARLDLDSEDSLLTGLNAASLKALYLCADGDTSCEGLTQTSEPISLVTTGNEQTTGSNQVETGNEQTTGSNDVVVPVPAPLGLIGLGLVGLAIGGGLRRRR